MICPLLLGYLVPKFSLFCLFVSWLVVWLVGWLIGWFYDMSTLVRIFNTKVLSFLFVSWLVDFMICQILLGYLIPKSSHFDCVLVGWFCDMSTLVRIFNTKVSFFVCVLVGWFHDMSTLVRIFNTNVFFGCLCVRWLVL